MGSFLSVCFTEVYLWSNPMGFTWCLIYLCSKSTIRQKYSISQFNKIKQLGTYRNLQDRILTETQGEDCNPYNTPSPSFPSSTVVQFFLLKIICNLPSPSFPSRYVIIVHIFDVIICNLISHLIPTPVFVVHCTCWPLVCL